MRVKIKCFWVDNLEIIAPKFFEGVKFYKKPDEFEIKVVFKRDQKLEFLCEKSKLTLKLI